MMVLLAGDVIMTEIIFMVTTTLLMISKVSMVLNMIDVMMVEMVIFVND